MTPEQLAKTGTDAQHAITRDESNEGFSDCSSTDSKEVPTSADLSQRTEPGTLIVSDTEPSTERSSHTRIEVPIEVQAAESLRSKSRT